VTGPSFHQDHRVVFEATMSASRPTRKYLPKEIYLYENVLYSWNPRCWKMTPHVWEDITNYVDKKEEACWVYQSQVRKEGPLSVKRIREWSYACGIEAGVIAAERFEIVRIIR